MHDRLNHTRTIFCVVLLLLVGMLAGCNPRPANVLDEKQMKAVFLDFLLLDSYFKNYSPLDSTEIIMLSQSVLDKHKITSQKWEASMQWYDKNSHVKEDIVKQLQEELAQKITHLDTLYSDSLDYERIRFIAPNSLLQSVASRQYLRLESDKQEILWKEKLSGLDQFQARDTLDLIFRSIIIPVDTLSVYLYYYLVDTAGIAQERNILSHQLSSNPDLVHLRIPLPDSLQQYENLSLMLVARKKELTSPTYLLLDSLVLMNQIRPDSLENNN